MGLTEANLGLIAGWGGTTRLPLLIGEGNAKLMFYTAARLSGQEAKEMGLVQKVVPRAQLMDTAMERKRELYPDWDINIISLEKKRSRNDQLDEMITLLESMKE